MMMMDKHRKHCNPFNTYVVFIWSFVALYGVFFIASFFKKNVRAKLVYKAPFYAFVTKDNQQPLEKAFPAYFHGQQQS